MASAHVSHSREPSITRLECDINPNFSFPVQPHNRSQSLLPPSVFGFPPSNSPVHSFAYPPRRGSVPPSNSGPLASASLNTTRPKSSSSNTALSVFPKPSSAEVTPISSLTAFSGELGAVKVRGPTYYAGGVRTGGRAVTSVTAPTIVNAIAASGTKEGHQRAESEMIGGPPLLASKKEDGTSVTTTERVLARPIVPTPPTGVRRGHAHRRSGAISSGDVWSLMSQSAPSLPLACIGNQSASSGTADATAQLKSSASASPVLSKSAPVSPGFIAPSPLPSPSAPAESSSEAGDRKSRVHFIDRVEIIPGPLSIDTETSSTITATGHSTNASVASADSVDSVIKAPITALPPILTSHTMAAPAAPGRRAHGRTRSNSQTLTLPTAALRATSDRPSTAGAILSSPILKTATEEEPFPNGSSLKRPATESPPLDSTQDSPTKPPQKKMHKKALSDSSPLVGTGSFGNDLDTAIANKDLSTSEDQSSEQTIKKKKKKSKKQIKNWAGTILGKGRGLRHSSKRQFKTMPRRSPTPPLPRPENRMPGDNEWIPAAWNENYVVMAVDDSVGPSSSTESVVIADATESPIIDLDAALGPFKTPIGPSAGFAAARRRRMHSAVGLKANGYFHRRSESMPEMQLFSLEEDGHMDDVFEEEESEESESEDEEGKTNSKEGLGIGIEVVDEADGANWQEGVEMEWGPEDAGSERNVERRMSEPESQGLWRAHRVSLSVTTTLKAPCSNSSMNSKSSMATDTDADEDKTLVSPRKGAPVDIITSHSSGSTITASSPFLCPQAPDSPATFATALSNPNTPIMLDFATDDYADSAASFDLYSDFLGEPGPEMRMSVDDVPSLTSSSSTMTMNGIYHGMPSTPGVGSLGSLDLHVKEGKEGKEGKSKEGKSKKWSRVFSFWKSK